MSLYQRTVREYMTTPVVTVTVDDTLSDVQRELAERNVSSAVVVGRDGKEAGVVSYSDLLQLGHVFADAHGSRSVLELPSLSVGDVVKTRAITVSADATLAEAVKLMVDRKIHRVFTLEGDKPVGVLSTRNVMQVLVEAHEPAPLGSLVTAAPKVLELGATLGEGVRSLLGTRGAGAVVMEKGTPVGVFTHQEALAAREEPRESPLEKFLGYSMLCLPAATPVHRAAKFALALRARRVLALQGSDAKGLLTTLDFVRAAAPVSAA